MDEEAGLRELCIRAANKNLYFSGVSPSGRTAIRIETLEGPELTDFHRLWGGKIGPGRRGKIAWVVFDEMAEELVWKLLHRKDFKNSGKFWFAVNTIAEANGVSPTDVVARLEQ